jgi:hypothetical protein
VEATILFVAVSSLILFAVTSMRFGVDSREGFASKERELISQEIERDESSAPRRRRPSVWVFTLPLTLPVPRKCVSETCGA